jgi:type II secretory pathway component PulK
VPGVSPELFYGHYVRQDDGRFVRQLGLIDCVTVDAHSKQVNINYAPYPVLLAVAGAEPRVAAYIVEAREKKPFQSASQLSDEFPVSLSGEALSSMTTQSTSRFSLLASARTQGGILARVQAVVELHGQAGNLGPVQVLRWKDFYAQ